MQRIRMEQSVIQRIDPRLRLILLLVYSICVAIVQSPFLLMMLAPLPLACIFLSRLPWRVVARRLVALNLLLAILIGWIVWSAPENALLHSSIIFLRANELVLWMMGLWASSPMHSLGGALQWMRVPKSLAHLLLMADRSVQLMLEENERIWMSIKARGFRFRTSLHTYRTVGNAVGMLLVRSHLRAQRIDQAMRCRGFSGEFPAQMAPVPWTHAIMAGCILVYSIFLLVLDLMKRIH